MTASLGFDVGAYTAHRGSDGGGGGGGGAGAFDALSGFAHPLGVLRESASKEGALNELGGGGGDGGGGDKCGSGGGGGDDTDAIFPLSGMAAGGVQRFPSGGGVHNFPSVRLGSLCETALTDALTRAAQRLSSTATPSLGGGVRSEFDAHDVLQSSSNM
jgi:hypothetical protein